MDQQEFSGKWKEIKGEIRNQWGKLTDDDIEKSKGNVESIAGMIHERYGHAKDVTKQKLGELFNKFSDEAKHSVAEGTEAVKRTLGQSESDKTH